MHNTRRSFSVEVYKNTAKRVNDLKHSKHAETFRTGQRTFFISVFSSSLKNTLQSYDVIIHNFIKSIHLIGHYCKKQNKKIEYFELVLIYANFCMIFALPD